MLSAEEEFAHEMAELRRNYRGLLLNMLTELNPLRERLIHGSLSKAERELIILKSHQFCGTGSSYGFPEITQTGRTLEHFLLDFPDATPDDSLIRFDSFLMAAQKTIDAII